MAKTLYIIDGHAHIYAAYYAPMKPLTSPSGEPTKATYIFTTEVLGLIEKNKPDMLVVAMDSKTPTFRTKIYPDYKAHRPPMPDDMPVQIGRIEQILDAMKIPVMRVDGFEADDVIGTLARRAEAMGMDVYICSKDKDMLQLLDEHIFTYDIKTGQRTDSRKLEAQLGVLPQQFIDVLALQGDKADNIPGVQDVGPKTAIEWIKKYQTLENLYQHADDITGKRGENLRCSRQTAFLSRKLVVIDCSAPVEIDEKTFTVKQPDRDRLSQIFVQLGFTRLINQLGLKPPDTKQKLPQSATQAKTADEDSGDVKDGDLFAASSARPGKTSGIRREYKLVDNTQAFEDFVSELAGQPVFAIDTETTSIDPMRAELVGMSFCWQPGRAFYLPVRAPMGQKHLDVSFLRSRLKRILADGKVKKIGQNIKYDILVLRNAGMELKGVFFDTMVASYCLAGERGSHSLDTMAGDYLGIEKIPISSLIGRGKNQLTFDMVDTAAAAEYSARDADLTFQLYEYLTARLQSRPTIKKLFEQLEMPLIFVLAQMEYNGVSLDVKLLRDMSHELAQTISQLQEKIYSLAGTVFNIDSTKQLAEVLFVRLGLTPLKSGKAGPSTDIEVLEELADQHEIVPLLIQYRQTVKLQNTYVDKLGQLINPRTGRVHASFNQTVTVTGRLSSSDPNLQNIPVRTELGKKIRSAFVPAAKDYCILSADYSQIELRLLAHFSRDKTLLEAFAADMDIHRFVASQIYSVPLGEVTEQMRSQCKAVNFGIIYGQGAFGLSRTVGISQARAKKFIDDYFARYSSIRQFMEDSIERTGRCGYAETILGRQRKITGLAGRDFNKRSQARRLAINTIIQGSAADLIKVAMINIQRKIDRENLPIKMILQIHDELVFELPQKNADADTAWITEEMTGAIKLDVPLKVDVKIGPTWLG